MKTAATEEQPNLLLAALEERWRKYRIELKRCRAEFSNDAVHDLRVATRRMLALIQLLNSISPRPRLKKLSRVFKDQLDEFDDLRDTQVILARLSGIIRDLPQLRNFQENRQSSEKHLLKVLSKKVKRLEIPKVAKRIRKTHESIKAETDNDTDLQLLQAVDGAFLRVRKRFSVVDVAHPATIHRVRVAFKSFRYMVEIVHPLLPDFPIENLKRMNEYQTLMGEIQDAEVFTKKLEDFTEHASLSDPEPVRRYMDQCHADVLSAYVKDMNQLVTFWRSAPDLPFSWEKIE